MAALSNVSKQELADLIEKSNCADVFSVSGYPSWSFLGVAATDSATQYEIKTLLLQELFVRGILSLGTHNLIAAHSQSHIKQLMSCYRAILPGIAERAREVRVGQALRTEPLQSLFKVR